MSGARVAVGGGYILIETMVAMAVLGLSMLTLQQAIREAVLTRAISEDYTVARFLLEQKMSELVIEPELTARTGQGTFSGHDRFSFEYSITTVDVPRPELPAEWVDESTREMLAKQYKGKMPKVSVTVRWTRVGVVREATGETLLPPEQLWEPKEEGAV